jgi:hypothetical protein
MATPDQSRRKPRVRSSAGTFVKNIETAERDAKACRMRSEGRNYDEVATALGFTDRSTARRAVERGLLAVVAEPAAHLRTLELARLDILLSKAWEVLQAEHIVVSQGRVMEHPVTGEPMVDHQPVLHAIDRVLRISERRCKLLGLDAPVRIETISVDQIEAEITRLAAELGMNDRPRIPQ